MYLVRGSSKVNLPLKKLPKTGTQWWIQSRNITTELMLDKEICKARDHIHLLPLILYVRFCIVVSPSLLHHSMPPLEKIQACNLHSARVKFYLKNNEQQFYHQQKKLR